MMTNQARVAAWLDQDRVRNFILAVIIFNAILLGLETSKSVMSGILPANLGHSPHR